MCLSALPIALNDKNHDILHNIHQTLVLPPNINKDLLSKELRGCTKSVQDMLGFGAEK